MTRLRPPNVRLIATIAAWLAFVGLVGVSQPARRAEAALTSYAGSGINDPRAITNGPDGALWFVNENGGTIGRISTSGAVNIFDDPTLGTAVDITSGPDGNLWVTSSDQNSISKITPSGIITTFPGVGSRPNSITAGSDGALWFTRTGSGLNGSIGRITTTGQVTSYFFDENLVGRPRSITAGPDGALWFVTGGSSGPIGRITTGGVLTTFAIADSIVNQSGLTELAPGPDGALWFTSGNSNSIGRITTAGSVQVFTIPGVRNPGGIVAGPDGAVWFTEGATIGRITTLGVVTHRPTPGDRPNFIATGPDGALWFTSWQSNSIGRMTTDTAICAPWSDVLGWWRGEDSLTSEAGNGLLGTSGYANGVVGRGFALSNGSDLAVSSWLAGLTKGITVEAWVKPVDNGMVQTVMSQWDFPSTDDSARTFNLTVGPGNAVVWTTDETSTRRPEELVTSAPALWDGNFHHLAATWNQNEFVIYVDGLRVAARPSQRGTLNPAVDTQIRLGSKSGVGSRFGLLGLLDEPALYSRALTATEIATIHAVGSVGKCR